jgi:predicted amidohydrolase
MSCALGDKEANLRKIIKNLDLARRNDCDLVLFPELATTGYALYSRGRGHMRKLAEPIPGPFVNHLIRQASEHDLHIATGILESSGVGNKLYNSAVLIAPQGLIGKSRKTHLFGKENEIFTAGTIQDLRVHDTELGRIGITICFDFEFPEVPRILAMRGAEIILHPAAEMSPYEEQHSVHARARALENGVFVIDSNRVGDEPGLHFIGRSQIVAPDGRVLVAARNQEKIIFARLDKGMIRRMRGLNPYLAQRRPGLYSELCKPSLGL